MNSVTRLTRLEIDDPRWIDFVGGHPDAAAFHLPAWGRAVAECYRFPLFALALLGADGLPVAGLPVIEVRQPLRARRWSTLPFTDHCPVLSSGPEAEAELVAQLRSLLATTGVRRLDIRADVTELPGEPVAVRHLLEIAADPTETYAGFHKSQVQRNIRRAEREGVTVRAARRETDLTEIFYGLHRATRQRQGVPVQPRRFFDSIWRHMIEPGHGSVLIAEHGGGPVAAAVFFRHQGKVIYKFGASDAAAWDVRPNHALFWHAIQAAAAAGDFCFDWGRTDLDNTGLRSFKSSWGARELPLSYSVALPAGVAVPMGPRATAGPIAPAHEESSTPSAVTSKASELAATVIRKGPPWVCSAVGAALYRFTA